MATSVVISSDNNAPLTELVQDQYHHHQPIRRSISGRRKPKGGEEKKKKTPQRGMGVEKLERQRVEEMLKKMAEPTHNLQTCLNTNHIMGTTTAAGHMGLNQNQTSYLGFHGSVSDRFQTDHFGIGGSSSTTSFHSSSIPDPLNFISSCHKKKKVNNAENLGVRPEMYMRMYSDQAGFLGLNVGDNQKIINHTTKQPPLVPQQGCHNVRSTRPVVAVHRKGSEEGNTRVVMEYEFFPGGRKDCCNNNNNNEDDELVMMGNSEGSTCTTSCVGFDAFSTSTSTSSIDLSLKLSY
ncbi:hypothetical protein ACJIZ3_012669 [Penstemon smallii]|uniref:Uncharacterized protein n=1 Tax=Penstemon smallii TaxID=265156 RepID=A0ABD3UMQ0_9LAMI